MRVGSEVCICISDAMGVALAVPVQHLHVKAAGIDGCTYGTCLFTEIEVEEGEGAETGPAA